MIHTLFLVPLFVIVGPGLIFSHPQENDSTTAVVKRTVDFTITGDGKSSNWNTATWLTITKQESSTSKALQTQIKLLYSNLGIYFLFRCEDQKLSATLQEDFVALFKEDVVEVFLWPDPALPIYLEYELSPLNFEVPVLIPNINGRTSGWLPWHYEGKRRIQHKTAVRGGEKTSNASISEWTAEFFIPFALLGSLVSEPPGPGTRWRANFYRRDYDDGYTTWTWQKTTRGKPGNFHEYKKFGTIIFE